MSGRMYNIKMDVKKWDGRRWTGFMCPYSVCMGFALFSARIAGNPVFRKTWFVFRYFHKISKSDS
jgi:hypothetical protein